MSKLEFYGYVMELALAVLVALIVFLFLSGPTRKLFDLNVRLKAAKEFYLRTLLTTLLLVSMIPVAGRSFEMASDARFMEYVWEAAGRLRDVIVGQAIVLGLFMVIVSVVTIGLGRLRDE